MRLKVAATGAAIALVFATVPSRASITTDDFVAIVAPSADYVAASSELALARADDRGIGRTAAARVAFARALLADLAAWHRARAAAEIAAAHAPTLDGLGPTFDALSLPLEVVARTASSPGYLFTRLPSASRLDDAGRSDYARLAGLAGPPFADFYVDTDRAALLRLQRACKDFVLNGDDETLRALAVHTLPKLAHLIATLDRA